MDISNVITLLGGVALFLFGMTLMGEGLKKVAGSKLVLILYKLSSTPLKGMLLGTGVTAVIQSSSATSVMVVGFVNSGMMTVRQAIAVIMGALIGTSITGWIICLSSIEGSGAWVSLLSTSTISALVAIIGIILRMFSHKQARRHVGDILLGFAVLMFGMHSMSGAVEPLKESESFIRLMTTFSNPLLGILVGAAFAAILQSASAAVGILQALSMTGAISFAVAYPMILGIAVGSSVPVLLSALNAKVGGRRAALSYLVIEIIGVVLCGAVFYAADAAMDLPIKNTIMTTVSIAAVNTIFRAITGIVLLPFLGGLEKLVSVFAKESEEERSANAEFDRLDERFLKHPALAIEQSGLTVNSMARCSKENVTLAIQMLDDFSDSAYVEVEQAEDLTDRFEDKLGAYLMKINNYELSPNENRQVSKYLHTLSDLERISDHAMNLAETAQEIHEKKIVFSANGKKELSILTDAVLEILDLAFSAYEENDLETAYKVEPLEECIDMLCNEMKLRHLARLQDGRCSLSVGFVFNDILSNFERVADHCSNLAIAIIELHGEAFDAHDYVINLKELHSHNFDELYAGYSEKYMI